MKITLDSEHREALRDMLLAFLNLCGDIPRMVDQGKMKKAELRAHQSRDCLDLLLGGIGLKHEEAPVELTLGTEDAERIFTWLRKEMIAFHEIENTQETFDETALSATLVLSTCEGTLAAIRSARRSR